MKTYRVLTYPWEVAVVEQNRYFSTRGNGLYVIRVCEIKSNANIDHILILTENEFSLYKESTIPIHIDEFEHKHKWYMKLLYPVPIRNNTNTAYSYSALALSNWIGRFNNKNTKIQLTLGSTSI